MTEIVDGNFPFTLTTITNPNWFISDKNDNIFIMIGRGASPEDHIVTWNATTNEEIDWGETGNEPKLDRSGLYMYNQVSSHPWKQGVLADGPPTVDLDTYLTGQDFWVSHGDAGDGILVGIDPYDGGARIIRYDPVTHTRTYVISDKNKVAADHLSLGWLAEHGNEPGLDQWVLSSAYNGGSNLLLHEGVGFWQISDVTASNWRLLAHHYSAGNKNDYYTQPHATMSPDGKVVMWSSTMNVEGGRLDVSIALTPTR